MDDVLLSVRVEEPELAADQRPRRVSHFSLGDQVGARDGAIVSVDQDHDGGRRIDRPAVPLVLVSEILFASLDEEIRDVQDSLPKFLIEEPQELREGRAVAHVPAKEIRDDLTEFELTRQEAGRRVL
jgi:hypothetical protein